MKYLQRQFDRIRQRLEELRIAALTPARKRAAWANCQATGQLPDDPALRDLCQRLQQAREEFVSIHQPAPASPED